MHLASAIRRLKRGSTITALLSLSLALLATSPASARRGEAPLATPGVSARGVDVLSVTAPDVAQIKAQDEARTKAGEKRHRFAEPRAVSVTPYTSGSWTTQLDGTRVWRLLVAAQGATDLNLAFTTYELPYNAKLYVISTEEDYYEGPYTHADNKAHGQLWVPMIPGGEALIELQLPAQTKFEPRLELTQVNYGYRDMFNRDPHSKQGACNNDVICPEGLPWADQIQAVGVYSINGSFACTGTMIMDVPGSFRNFFLTAFHCGISVANAPSVTVYWNYESPVCGQLSGGSLAENQTGATFRANRQDVDMCLIELDAPPNPISNVYWAGWDRSNGVPSGSVGIHHPGTDEKAISFNTDALTTVNSCIGGGGSSTHWQVNNWEDGTTEPGSSGSAIFDPNNQLVVGFLSGGTASCFSITSDCYGKFAVAWDGSSAATRLRDWLDPGGVAPLTRQGSYPTGAGVALFDSAATSDDCGGTSNGICEPGETITVLVDILAAGGDLTGISGVLSSSTSGVTVTQGASAWSNLSAGVSGTNLTAFEVTLDQSVPCFSTVDFNLVVNANEGGPFNMPFSKGVGQVTGPAGLPLAIPDNTPAGATSQFTVADNVVLTDLDVRVEISHTYVGDLRITLTSPSSTTVTLLDRPGVPASTFGCGDNDMNVTFDDASGVVLETFCAGATPWYSSVAAPVGSLAAFNGENAQGTWTLNVSDNAGQDTGSIVDWELLASPGLSAGVCDPCNPGVDVIVTTSTPLPVALMTFPGGGGDALSAAQDWDGVVGSTPSTVDATVTVQLLQGGTPVVGHPANLMLLQVTSPGNWNGCAANSPVGPTNASGITTFSSPLLAGGYTLPGAAMEVAVGGLTINSITYNGSAIPLDIRVMSPDIDGNFVVNLADLGMFATDFSAGYDFRSDFQWNGVLNLVDVGEFANAFGDACTTIVPGNPTASADVLGVYFDRAGRDHSTELRPGELVTAYLVLQGPGSSDGNGVDAWDARLVTSPNLVVKNVTLPEGSINVGRDLEYIVGTGGMVVPKGTPAVLATLTLEVTDTKPAHLSLAASSLARGGSPLVARGEDIESVALSQGQGVPVAYLNDENAPRNDGVPVPRELALKNVPNPFNPSTEIRFNLPRDGRAEVRIFDVSGRLVSQLDGGLMAAGAGALTWNGVDHRGAGVRSGLYFYQLLLNGESLGETKKMNLVK